MLNRRTFIKNTSTLAILSAYGGKLIGATANQKKTILLCSSWQTFNIGDIAHTPGVMTILEKQLPQVDVILWPHNVGNGVRQIIEKRFPKCQIVQTNEDVAAAFKK